MKIKEQSAVDFLIGFFTIPFIVFTFKTTLLLASSPQSISDGMGIIYIASITGWYYIFNKKSSITFTENPVFGYARSLGLLVFGFSYFYIY